MIGSSVVGSAEVRWYYSSSSLGRALRPWQRDGRRAPHPRWRCWRRRGRRRTLRHPTIPFASRHRPLLHSIALSRNLALHRPIVTRIPSAGACRSLDPSIGEFAGRGRGRGRGRTQWRPRAWGRRAWAGAAPSLCRPPTTMPLPANCRFLALPVPFFFLSRSFCS